MFYSSLRTVEDGKFAADAVVAEVCFQIAFWAVLEAFFFEWFHRFLIVSSSKTQTLFYSLNMDFIAGLWGSFSGFVNYFSYLGSGNLWHWLERGFIVWLCTGIPLILYQVSKRPD